MIKKTILFLSLSVLGFADVKYAVGSFVQGATTVTVGWQPTALRVYATDQTAAGSVANARLMIGFCAYYSSTTTCASAWSGFSDSGGATASTVAKRSTTLNRLSFYTEPSGTNVAEANIAITSTGFTATWTGDAGSRIFNYEAIGGSDITAEVITASTPAGTGTHTYTAGFAPTVVFMIAGATSSASNTPATPATNWDLSYGFCVGTDTAQSAGIGSQSATALSTSIASSWLTTSIMSWESSSVPSVSWQATCSAMDSTSFTLNYTSTSGVAGPDIVFLVISGGSWQGGVTTQPTSTGNQTLTTTGFTPKGVTLLSIDHAHATTIQNHMRVSVGGSDGTHYFNDFVGGKYNVTVQIASTSMSQSTLLNMMTEAGASPATQATADTVSFSSGSATVHWSAVDATARDIGWVAIGSAAAPPAGTVKHRITR